MRKCEANCADLIVMSRAKMTEDEGITAPGMQILGFVNQLLPKSPNPLSIFKPGDFS